MGQVSVIAKQRDIFLVPFPYSDMSGRKVRPVLVLSNDVFNSNCDDVIVCGITSNIKKCQFAVQISTSCLKEGTLYAPCLVKTESVFKLDRKLLIKRIGALKKDTFLHVLNVFRSLFR